MEERLAQLLYSYKKNDKPVDSKFVESAFTIIVEYYQLDNVVRLDNLKYGKVLGAYNNNKDLIQVYRKSVVKGFNNYIKEYLDKNVLFDMGEYIAILETILHEVEHFNQYKSLQYRNSAEGVILKSEIEAFESLTQSLQLKFKFGAVKLSTAIMKISEYSKNVKKLYEYSPTERLASIKSIETSQNIANLLNDENTEIQLN